MRLTNITKKCYLKYEDDNHEILKTDDKIIVRNKNTNKYFETTDFEKYNIPWMNYTPLINDYKTYIRLSFVIVFFIINLVFYFIPHHSSNLNVFDFTLYSTIYTCIQVFFHESFHVLAFHKAGRKIDTIGFKFNYIFPSFYIRMNQMYMLSDFEKLYIHSAGIFFNCVSNGLVLIFSWILNLNTLNIISRFFVIGILMNTFPILNSDGYKIMLTIFSYNEHKERKKNKGFIKVFSYLNIVVSIIYFFSLFMK